MVESVEHTPAAEVLCNSDFILVETYSGYRSYSRDPDVQGYFLSVDASDEVLGSAVVESLARSRQIAKEEIAEFFDYRKAMALGKQWTEDLMARYGYKTKRALFKSMKSVSIRIRGNEITLLPSRQEGTENWVRTKDDGIEDVIISASSAPTEVGSALRLALSRCI